MRNLICGGNFARELAVARNHPTGVKEVVQPAVRAADQYSARIQCRKTPVIILRDGIAAEARFKLRQAVTTQY